MAWGLALMAASSIYSGWNKLSSNYSTASDLREEGMLAYQESMRTANIIEEEGLRFAKSQSLQYIGSGVQLVGSALITIAQTKKYAQAEADATRSQGAANLNKANTTASRTESEGRAGLVSGLINGIGTYYSRGT